MTPEEREELIQDVVERMLLTLPEVVGNLMTANAMHTKMTRDFYTEHPEFKDHREIVRDTIDQVESLNHTSNYKDILEEAIPKIRERIKVASKLSMDIPSKRPPTDINGAL